MFPDVVETDVSPKQVAKVLFDVEFNQKFHSHLLADIELVVEDGELEYEVRSQLPFSCKDFATAAVQYYQYTICPQGTKVSHSGPKDVSIVTNNVMRAQWQVELEAS